MRSSIAVILGIVVSAACARAAAQEPAAPALTLTVAEGCPDGALLEEQIASLLGRPFREITIPDASRATLSITREEDRYVLVVASASGEQTLRDPSCAALVRAAALIVALQIDADAATLAAATAAERIATPEVPPPPAAPTPGPRRLRFVLDHAARLGDPSAPFVVPGVAIGVGAALEAGLVPSVAASFFARAVVRVDRFEVHARVAYAVEQGQASVVGVRASAVSATLLACGRPFDASFALALCGGVEGGDVLARSVGISNPTSSDGGFFSGVVALWLPLFPWPGVELALGAEGWARASTPIFEIEASTGVRTVYAPDPYGGRFALAIHWNP